MKQSLLFTKTLREEVKDELSVNAQYLIRGGYVDKLMAGVYTYLPLGFRVYKKIENIVREEMNAIGGQEMFMPALQPKALWEKTGRWSEGIGEDVMYKIKDDMGKEYGLGPTHEEVLTEIVSRHIKSYNDLPFSAYQIQTKFRKELRAKSGLLRGREFLMKDLYSFHTDEDDFKRFYEIAKKAYFNVFKRCGLDAIYTEASGGGFTNEFTHEFQVLSDSGEDLIIFCKNGDFAQNKEICKLTAGNKCPKCSKSLIAGKSIEVGNIFPLGVKYSSALGAHFVDSLGMKKPIIMGCYGIGMSRLLAAIVEVHHDNKGIIWPESVSPFDVHLIKIDAKDEKENKIINNKATEVYEKLIKAGVDVLFDDRDGKSAGEKFADADLIGISIRLVISEKTLKQDSVELKKRSSKDIKLVKILSVDKEVGASGEC